MEILTTLISRVHSKKAFLAIYIASLCVNASDSIWYISMAKLDPFYGFKQIELDFRIQNQVQLGQVDTKKGLNSDF